MFQDVWREALTPTLVPRRSETTRRFDAREYMIERASARPSSVRAHAKGSQPR